MTARPQSPEPGMYYIPNEIGDLGFSAGDFLHVDPADENYIHMRLVNKQVVDMILSSPGVRLVQRNTPQPSVPGCEPFAVEGHGTKADEIDVDALLANAKIAKEPSRAICPQCNTAFIRDMAKARKCRACRKAFPRDCVDCGEHFDAHHFMVKRCPPCRARHGGVRCDTCNEYFVRDRCDDTSCRRCR